MRPERPHVPVWRVGTWLLPLDGHSPRKGFRLNHRGLSREPILSTRRGEPDVVLVRAHTEEQIVRWQELRSGKQPELQSDSESRPIQTGAILGKEIAPVANAHVCAD